MYRFRNMLFYYNDVPGASSALRRAKEVAKQHESRLTIVEVLEDDEPSDERLSHPALSKLKSNMRKEREKNLQRRIKTARRYGVDADGELLFGAPFLALIRRVLEGEHDVVVKTAEGGGGLRETLFGSTAFHLMRKCPCPVWVMKPSRIKRYGRILAAVNPQPGDKDEESVNNRVLELALSLAHLDGSVLHVVNTWRVYGETLLSSGRSRIDKEEMQSFVHETHSERLHAMDNLLARFDLEGIDHHVHLIRGDAEEAIPEFAAGKRINLIVMGTVCRTGIAGFFIGNTAERILHKVDCSVLTVKPEAFVSPVKLSHAAR